MYDGEQPRRLAQPQASGVSSLMNAPGRRTRVWTFSLARRNLPTPPPPPPHKGGKGGKGKGKTKAVAREQTKTPDGKPICFPYQRGKCSRGSNSKFVHVCQLCLGPHPRKDCKTAPQADLGADFQ